MIQVQRITVYIPPWIWRMLLAQVCTFRLCISKVGVAGSAQAHGEVSAAVYELLRGVVALHARLAGFLAQLRAGGFLQCSLASLAAVRCDSTMSLAMKVGIGSMLPAPKHRRTLTTCTRTVKRK